MDSVLIKQKLKTWERDFEKKNGRKPAPKDVKAAGSDIKDLYKQYYNGSKKESAAVKKGGGTKRPAAKMDNKENFNPTPGLNSKQRTTGIPEKRPKGKKMQLKPPQCSSEKSKAFPLSRRPSSQRIFVPSLSLEKEQEVPGGTDNTDKVPLLPSTRAPPPARKMKRRLNFGLERVLERHESEPTPVATSTSRIFPTTFGHQVNQSPTKISAAEIEEESPIKSAFIQRSTSHADLVSALPRKNLCLFDFCSPVKPVRVQEPENEEPFEGTLIKPPTTAAANQKAKKATIATKTKLNLVKLNLRKRTFVRAANKGKNLLRQKMMWKIRQKFKNGGGGNGFRKFKNR